MNTKILFAALSAFLLVSVNAFAEDGKVTISSPANGATVGSTDAAGDAGVLSTGMANLQCWKIVADPSALERASQAGAMGVRATPNMSWDAVEPSLDGLYQWNNQDNAVTAVQARGLEYFRIINSSRAKYNPSPDPKQASYSYLLPHYAPDTNMDLWEQYKKFVRAVVRRYYKTAADGNPDAMPGLTKPNHYWFYTPEVGTWWIKITDPVQRANDYAAMFQLTYDAIHEVDPDARLFIPFDGRPYLAAFVDGFLPRATIDYHGYTGLTRTQVATSAAGADAITFTKTLLQTVHPDAYDLHLYGDAESIPGQKAWLSWYVGTLGLPAKPVHSMEGGEPFGALGEDFPQGPDTCSGGPVVEDPARLAFQSAALVKHFALAFASGYASVTFNSGSEYADAGAWFGDLDLVDACSNTRPAYYTYKLARQKLVPFVTSAEVPGGPAGVRLVRFTFSTKGDVWVAWVPGMAVGSTAPYDLSALLSFPTAKVTHAVTLAGQSSASESIESSNALHFGGTPIFVEASPALLLRVNGDANAAVAVTNPVTVDYSIRGGQGQEFFLVLDAPAMNVLLSYLNAMGRWVPLPANLGDVTPFTAALADGDHTLYTGTVPPGAYSLCLGYDTVSNGRLNLDAAVYDCVEATVR